MKSHKFIAAALGILTSFAAGSALRAQSINMQYVTVGNPGNAADPATGSVYGSVGYTYNIGEYDVTDSQYCTFLNAVDPTGANALGLYDSTATDAEYGITFNSGAASGSKYSVISGYANMPVENVNYWSTLRFVNWMNNGEGSASTETGAYTLQAPGNTDGNGTPSNASSLLTNPQHNAGATVWLPTENEWYKAAYYDPVLNSGLGGYYTYATQSNTAPGNIVGSGVNEANYPTANGYSVTQSSSYNPSQNYLTAVGSFTNSASYYGTYDQSGDVDNWTSTTVISQYPLVRGGSWATAGASTVSSSDRGGTNPASEGGYGFRVASAASQAVNMQWVTVGNPGNAPDPATGPVYPFTGGMYGSVGYTYNIGEYDVTDSQYCAFLNAVDPSGANTLALYSPQGDAEYGITFSSGAANGSKYSVISGYASMPVVDVDYWSTLRFVNWMNNGGGNASTETGAYTLIGGNTDGYGTPSNAAALFANPQHNAGATVWLPSENEWYKAAYYDSANGTYSTYATKSNTAPGNIIGNGANEANYVTGDVYCATQGEDFNGSQNYLTAVGSFTDSASYYGTYDQTGDVYNWESKILANPYHFYSVVRGGAWNTYIYLPYDYLASYAPSLSYFPGTAYYDIGFRVAGAYEPVNMQYITVGNPGNAADPATGYGSVGYTYDISQCDVTDSQYCTFLNAVDSTGSNTLALYSPQGDAEYGITYNSGAANGSKYSVISGYAAMPVVDVTFWDAVRFANFLDDGNTETGAYTLTGGNTDGHGTPSNGSTVTRNASATVWVPSENEWYKAAYYDPALNSGAGGYWTYATQSNTAPGNIVGSGANEANYVTDNGLLSVTQSGNEYSYENYLTAVGSFTGSPSYYGTYDQNGDVSQWNDPIVLSLDYRLLHGGNWGYGSVELSSSSRYSVAPSSLDKGIGFRVARGVLSSAYWTALNFTSAQLAEPAISGDSASPAGDGIPNLMKYALNLNPWTCGVSGLPAQSIVTTGSGNYLTLTYTQVISATDITYTVQVSTDLKTWNSGPGYAMPPSAIDNPDGVTRTATVQAANPVGSAPVQFMRLLVTGP